MKIKSARRIEPELARCIEVDAIDRLFAAGGVDGKSFISHNSVAQRNIVFSTILRPESWRFLGIDLKRVELSGYRAYSNVVLGIATELEDALTVLRFASQTMMRRYSELEQLGLQNFLDLPSKGQALMVMVDEAGELLGSSGVKALSEDTYIPNLNGRRNLSELKIGDVVFDANGKPTRVLDKYEPEAQEQFNVRFVGTRSISTGVADQEVITAGADHYWVVDCPDPDHNEPHIVTTRQLHEELKITAPGKQWTVLRPVHGLDLPNQELSLTPETVGALLSGVIYPEGPEERQLVKDGVIPDRYLYSSVDQRRRLLTSLYAGGYLKLRNPYTVQSIQRLQASLGLQTILSTSFGVTSIDYTEYADDRFVIESIKPVSKRRSKRMFCIRVASETSQFLCGENFIPTHNTDEGKEQDLLKGEASIIIGSIARLGRAAGVHLVIATQRPDATLIPGETKANLGVRLNCGRTDSNASSMILGSGEGMRVKANPRGRLYLRIFGDGDHGQGFFADPSWIDDYLAKNGKNPDGTPLSQKQSRLATVRDMSEFGEGADLDSREGIDNAAVIEQIRRDEENGIDDEDWGFSEADNAEAEDGFESVEFEDEDDENEEPSAPAERTDSWGGLELGGGNSDRNHRAEDDWDDELDALISENFDGESQK